MKLVLKRPKAFTAYQRRFLDDSARYCIMEAATKTGKTTSLLQWIIEQALQRKTNELVWWLAPSHNQAKMAYQRCISYIEQIRAQGAAQGFVMQIYTNDSQKEIRFVNPPAGTIQFRTAEKPDLLFGHEVWALVFDEATRSRREAWSAARSTLTFTRGKAKIIGNVKGNKNWVTDLKKRAGTDPEVSYYKVTFLDAVEAGLHPMAEFEDAKKNIPYDDFLELYMCVPREGGSSPFKPSALEQCATELSQNQPVFFGVDFGRSHDYTAIIGLDYKGDVAYVENFGADKNRFSYNTITDRVANAVYGQYAIGDATGTGDALMELLSTKVGSTVFDGFIFSNDSKTKLIESLAVAIQNNSTHFPVEHDGEQQLYTQLYNYESQLTPSGLTTYNAPEGEHDDLVIAYALSWLCYKRYSENQAHDSGGILYIGEA